MSYYTLAIKFWSTVAALGLAAPFIALAAESATKAVGSWLSSLHDEPVILSHHGPLSVP